MKIQVAMYKFLCFLLLILFTNCSEDSIQTELDHSLLEIKTLSLENITINNYWVWPNLGNNKRLYIGEKNSINVPYTLIQTEDSVYLDYYNDSTISIDSLRFIMYSTNTLIESAMPSLYFSPDSKFNENISIYSDFTSLLNDEFLEFDDPEINDKYDYVSSDTNYSHTELTWDIDTLINIFADTLDNYPNSTFMLRPSVNYTLMEFYSEEATSGDNNKDPKILAKIGKEFFLSTIPCK